MYVTTQNGEMLVNLDHVLCLKANDQHALVAIFAFVPPNNEAGIELYRPAMTAIGNSAHPSTQRVIAALVAALKRGDTYFDIAEFDS